jgi:uncharacterized protein with HEPN domain
MRRDNLRIQDMLTAIDKIEKFTSGIDFKDLEDDDMRKSAIMAELMIIGEASKNISEELRQKHLDVELDKASALRNILVHAYLGIEWEILWNTIQEDLPKIKKQLRKIH